jgi:hypothetical protein
MTISLVLVQRSVSNMKKRIKEIEALLEDESLSDEESDKLMDELREIDPWNDYFHLGCKSWPNCEEGGCCKE